MATLDRPMLEFHDPGRVSAAVLTVLTHAVLAVLLIVGVRWQNRPPEAVFAELWSESAISSPAPAVEQKIEEPKEPPKEIAKPEPAAEPKAAPKPDKPDIAVERERQRRLKEQKALEEKAAREKAAKEKAAKEKAAREKADTDYRHDLADQERKRMLEQAARESPSTTTQAAAPNRGPTSLQGDPKARAEYADRIKAKIRRNIVIPPDVADDLEAIFDVTQLPTGDVGSVKLRKSSGVRAYDEAVERAIRKSSPLPRPDRPELFERELVLRFRPSD